MWLGHNCCCSAAAAVVVVEWRSLKDDSAQLAGLFGGLALAAAADSTDCYDDCLLLLLFGELRIQLNHQSTEEIAATQRRQ